VPTARTNIREADLRHPPSREDEIPDTDRPGDGR
jgi:hypothetical protein